MGVHGQNIQDPNILHRTHNFQDSNIFWNQSKYSRFEYFDRTSFDYGSSASAGRAGRGGSGRGGRGGRFPKRKEPSSLSRKGGEVGACKDLEGHIFTIGSGNKGKDGDMLRTSMEKMATYIGTKYDDEAAQEWTSGKKIVLQEPAYLQAILIRHAERVKATRECIQLRLKTLRAEKTAIEAEIISAPTNWGSGGKMTIFSNGSFDQCKYPDPLIYTPI